MASTTTRATRASAALTLGYEFLQGYSWALDARLYRAASDWSLGDWRSAAGVMAGIQFY